MSRETFTDLQAKVAQVESLVNLNASRINKHADRLDQQDRQIRQESLDRKISAMMGKFAVYGYKWKIRDFGTPSNAIRRQFIRKFFRSVLVNQQLLPPTGDESVEFGSDLITDLKPLGFRDDASFEMTIGNLTVYHAIKEKLPSARIKIRLRPMQPKIISAMVDDALRHRRELLDSSPSRTLYVETKNVHPYVVLMERKTVSVGGIDETRREVVDIPWTDPHFTDPLMHHDSFGKPVERPASTATGGGNINRNKSSNSTKPKNPKPAARGGNSARGGGPSRGGGSSRGGGPNTRNGRRPSRGNDESEDEMQ